MNLFKIIILILIFMGNTNIFSQTTLRFKFKDGEQFKVESVAYNKIITNDKQTGVGYLKKRSLL